jgi:GNAT superfamily N-acetyltransferase
MSRTNQESALAAWEEMFMSDAWMPTLRLNLSRQEFDQLPRHPAYRYEYLDGSALLAPWPRYYHAQLDLVRSLEVMHLPGQALLRPARAEDLDVLVPLFVTAFAHLQPFGSLTSEHGRLVAEQCLQHTFTGGDGPWVEPASFVAMAQGRVTGAILITLLPGGDAMDAQSYHWNHRPPEDLWALGHGQPHLTWVFVDRLSQGTGLGTHLLQVAVRVLQERGYSALWTTFLVGNDSSLLWHWRNGFTLLPHTLSKRRQRR